MNATTITDQEIHQRIREITGWCWDFSGQSHRETREAADRFEPDLSVNDVRRKLNAQDEPDDLPSIDWAIADAADQQWLNEMGMASDADTFSFTPQFD